VQEICTWCCQAVLEFHENWQREGQTLLTGINETTLYVYHDSIRNAHALCVCNASQSTQFPILFPLPESLVCMSVPLYIM
jgi:hypothetical protein